LTIERGDKLTVGDARDFLAHGDSETELEAIFTTERRREQLARAVSGFDSSVGGWVRGSRRDERFVWVLPNRLVGPVLAGRITPTLAGRLATTSLGERILGIESAYMWLPYVALEATNELQHFRTGDHAVISIMIARGCRRLGVAPSARPWRPRFSHRVAALPIGWLYQFDPTPRSSAVLDRLVRGGLANVGHLVTFHPDAWKLLRSARPDEWRALQRALTRATS
jgi:hypothetical protein